MMHGQVVVGRSAELADGDRLVVDVDGTEIGVFRIDGALYAYGNYCVHAGGPVCQGMVINRVTEPLDAEKRSLGEAFSDDVHIVCPWHGYEYDLRTGAHPGDPRVRLRGYQVFEQGGEIVVEL
ncbi:Rieske (2Fe-2S) protein [Actinomadura sp. 1N219]|uniref:Rieske (2Fe-2S) protein n=1 Tax=Actinomadura sp. 1N219 TaxID=3375152 RepID=UPI0037B17C6A